MAAIDTATRQRVSSSPQSSLGSPGSRSRKQHSDPWLAPRFLPLCFRFVENFKYWNRPLQMFSCIEAAFTLHYSFELHPRGDLHQLNEYPDDEYPLLYGWTVRL